MNIIILLLLLLIIINNNIKVRICLLVFLLLISYLESIRKENFTESNVDLVNNVITKNENIKAAIKECMTDKEYKFFLTKIKCLSNSNKLKESINESINNVLPSKFSIAQYLLKSLTF